MASPRLTIVLTGDATQAKAAVQEAVKGLQGLDDQTEKSGKGFANLGTAGKTLLAVLGGAGLGAGLSALGSRHKEVQDAMLDFQVQTGATEKQAKSYGAAVIDMSKTHLQARTEIAATATAIVKLQGVEADNLDMIKKLSNAYLDYGIATKQDAAQAVAEFDDILDAWGLEAESALGIMDALILSSQRFGTDITSAQAALVQMAPTFGVLGLDIETALGFINLFAESGISATTTTAAFTSATDKLTDSTEKGTANLERIASTFGLAGAEMERFIAASPAEQFAEIATNIGSIEAPAQRAQLAIDLFGVKAGPKMAEALAGTQGNLDQFKTSVSGTGEVTEQAANKIESSLTNRLALLGKQATATGLEWTAAWSSIFTIAAGVPNVAIAIGSVVGALGTVGPAAVKMAATVGLALMTPPVGIIVLLLAALVAAGIAIYIFRDQIGDALGSAAERGAAALRLLYNNTIGRLDDILSWARDNWPAIAMLLTGPFAPLLILATDGFGIRSALIGGLSSLMDEAGQLAGRIVGAIADGIRNGAGIIGTAVNVVIGKLNPLKWDMPGWSPIIPAFREVGGVLMQNLATGVEDGGPVVEEALDQNAADWNIWAQIAGESAGHTLGEGIATGLEEEIPDIQRIAQEAADGVTRMFADLVRDAEGKLANPLDLRKTSLERLGLDNLTAESQEADDIIRAIARGENVPQSWIDNNAQAKGYLAIPGIRGQIERGEPATGYSPTVNIYVDEGSPAAIASAVGTAQRELANALSLQGVG